MYSDKYFFVPTAVNETQRPVDNILSNLDGEMMRILNDRNIPADVKWAQYNQILQRHNYMRRDRDKPIEIPFKRKQRKPLTLNKFSVLFQKHAYRLQSPF